jgi:ABC-type sulfate transport system permease subunit
MGALFALPHLWRQQCITRVCGSPWVAERAELMVTLMVTLVVEAGQAADRPACPQTLRRCHEAAELAALALELLAEDETIAVMVKVIVGIGASWYVAERCKKQFVFL